MAHHVRIMIPMISTEPGFLLAIEGIDGTGKSTIAAAIAEMLAGSPSPRPVVSSREPTRGPWGMKIRASKGRMSPEEELEAFMADRKEHVANVIVPALRSGAYVILDRYYYSTAAYQGTRGLDALQIIDDNEQFAPRPDLVLVLDLPVDEALQRIAKRGGESDPFELRETLESARGVFRSLQGLHVRHVDAQRTPLESYTHYFLEGLRQADLLRQNRDPNTRSLFFSVR